MIGDKITFLLPFRKKDDTERDLFNERSFAILLRRYWETEGVGFCKPEVVYTSFLEEQVVINVVVGLWASV